MAKEPPYVRDFLKRVPVVWDDVKFIDGFPGQAGMLITDGIETATFDM